MEKENLIPPCDKNNPNDPHYKDRHYGDYDHDCNWIWTIGYNKEEQEEE